MNSDRDRDALRSWFHAARENGWTDLTGIARAAIFVHGELAGFWTCDCCDGPVLDPAVASQAGANGEATMLGSISRPITLCEDCYEAATAARAKIVVRDEEVEDGVVATIEDDFALTDEEREFASYLADAEDARNFDDRGLIRGYPRDERRQLHRYQDQIEAERFRAGKQRD